MNNNFYSSPPPNDALPRPDLQEPAFRKYERYIARALERSYRIDPMIELHVTPRTFIARFKDAILGFQRYNYTSTSIPRSAAMSLRSIRLFELAGGEVEVRNEQIQKSTTDGNLSLNTFNFTDMPAIRAACEKLHNRQTQEYFYVKFNTREERDIIFNLSIEHGSENGEYDIMCDVINHNTIVLRV